MKEIGRANLWAELLTRLTPRSEVCSGFGQPPQEQKKNKQGISSQRGREVTERRGMVPKLLFSALSFTFRIRKNTSRNLWKPLSTVRAVTPLPLCDLQKWPHDFVPAQVRSRKDTLATRAALLARLRGASLLDRAP